MTGSTSACNHVSARILVNMGCYGNYEPNPIHEQAELDRTAIHGKEPTFEGPAVLWRSIGYSGTFPDLKHIKEKFESFGYEVKTIYLVRNWPAMIESAKFRHRERSFDFSFDEAHRENLHILKYISYLQPFHILNISLFFKYPEKVIKKLEGFTGLKFPEESYKDFFDADRKWEYSSGEWTIVDGVTRVWNLSKAYSNIPWNGSAATKNIGALFPGLMCCFSIDTAIEIGICNGFLTCALMKGLAAANNGKGLLVTCDINEHSCRVANSFKIYNPEVEVVILNEDSTKVDWGKHLQGREVGLASIDGDHSYEAAKKDIELVSPLVKLGGFMFCHDYALGHPGVIHAVDEFLEANLDWRQFVIPQRKGFGDYSATLLQKVGDLSTGWWDR